MLVKSQKLASSLKSNLIFRAFSPGEAYREGSVKSATQKSAVKLANGKATEVRRVYLVRGVTVMEREGSSWYIAQTRDIMFARAGDNVVFVREPGNLFDPSCVKVGLC